MTINATSRRDLLRAASTAIAYASGAAIVGTGMALASEAHSETIAVSFAGATPWSVAASRYRAGMAHFNALPEHLETSDPATFEREEQAVGDHVVAVEAAIRTVGNWNEFVEAFAIACDEGQSSINGDAVDALLAAARRLSGRA